MAMPGRDARADLVLLNGKVATQDCRRSFTNAFAIRGGHCHRPRVSFINAAIALTRDYSLAR
ncbi:MAG: hypothetical protein WB789_03650 [Thermoplasmata archaeon]